MSRRRWRPAAGFIFLAACALLPTATGQAADRSDAVRFGGRMRGFSTHVPDGPAPADGFPVILAFHGGGMRGAGMRRISGLDQVADRDRFIAVYPDGVGGHWNDGRATIRDPQDDVGFVAAMLDRIRRTLPADRRRIYATGLSNGALFVQRLGCELSGQIAGIAPVAGTIPVDMIDRCHPAHPVSVLQIAGSADPIMPFGGGEVADFGGAGEGGRVTSVAETVRFWAGRDGCGAAEPAGSLSPFDVGDPTRVARLRYSACVSGTRVVGLTVQGGGHVWPGGAQPFRPRLTGRPTRQLDAASVTAAFLLSLPSR